MRQHCRSNKCPESNENAMTAPATQQQQQDSFTHSYVEVALRLLLLCPSAALETGDIEVDSGPQLRRKRPLAPSSRMHWLFLFSLTPLLGTCSRSLTLRFKSNSAALFSTPLVGLGVGVAMDSWHSADARDSDVFVVTVVIGLLLSLRSSYSSYSASTSAADRLMVGAEMPWGVFSCQATLVGMGGRRWGKRRGGCWSCSRCWTWPKRGIALSSGLGLTPGTPLMPQA